MANVNLETVVAELSKVAFSQADDSGGSAMKYASKLKALEMLGRHFGLYEKQENTGLTVRIVDDIRERSENGE